MGLKYKQGRLTLKTKAGLMGGYIPEPNQEAKEKCRRYIKKMKG